MLRLSFLVFFLLIRRPPSSTLTYTLFPPRRSSDLDRRRGGRCDDLGGRGRSEGKREAGGAGEFDRHARGDSLLGHHRQLLLQRLLAPDRRSEEHTSELQSLMRISYAVFCLKKKKKEIRTATTQYSYIHDKVV